MRRTSVAPLLLAVLCLTAGCVQPFGPRDTTDATTRTTTTTSTTHTDVPISTATTREHQPGDITVLASEADRDVSNVSEEDIKNFTDFSSGKRAVIAESIECGCGVETVAFSDRERDYRYVRYEGALWGVYVTVV